MHPLDGIKLKLKRAAQHLRSITDIIDPIRNAKFQVVSRYDPDDGLFKLSSRFPEIDPDLSVIIGDCLHNMRSSLDYLIWQLVIKNGQTPIKDNMFPICYSIEGFNRQITRNRLQGISINAQTVVDALQPYHRGQPACFVHPLWILSELMNVDKHRTLTLITLVALGYDIEFKPQSGASGGGLRVGTEGIRLKHGVEFFGYRPEGAALFGRPNFAPIEEMDVDAQGNMFVAFQDGPVADRDVVVVLQEILDYIQQTVIPNFEPFFN